MDSQIPYEGIIVLVRIQVAAPRKLSLRAERSPHKGLSTGSNPVVSTNMRR